MLISCDASDDAHYNVRIEITKCKFHYMFISQSSFALQRNSQFVKMGVIHQWSMAPVLVYVRWDSIQIPIVKK